MLLPKHPIAGWGVTQRIAGLPSDYSAGSHSSILGMLFQHGIIGVSLYAAFWVSIWRDIVKGLSTRKASSSWFSFWLMAAVAMASFNLRALADKWWWDQVLTMTLWSLWGLILVGPYRTQACCRPYAAGAPATSEKSV